MSSDISQQANVPHNFHIKEGTYLDDRFVVGHCISQGGFGQVFRGHDLKQRKHVAIKVEVANHSYSRNHSILIENNVLEHMFDSPGFCTSYACGQLDRENYIVTDLLGLPVLQLFILCSYQFSLKTLLMLTDQMIHRLEQLHSRGFVHRDLKPENFMMGEGPEMDTVYLIDFGLAQMYRLPETGEHVDLQTVDAKVGTDRYMSRNAHYQVALSRRDDLESLVYILAYFASGGSLPWMNIPDAKDETRDKIVEKKNSVKSSQLFEGLPLEFAWFAESVKALGFKEVPNYLEYRKTFWNLASSLGYRYNGDYDWKILRPDELEVDLKRCENKSHM